DLLNFSSNHEFDSTIFDVCKHLEPTEPFTLDNEKSFICVAITATTVEILSENVLLGRMLRGDQTTISDRWSDNKDFDSNYVVNDITKSYKSSTMVTHQPYKYVKVDYYKDGGVALRFIFKDGPLNSGTTPYDISQLKSLNLLQKTFFKVQNMDSRFYRSISFYSL
ncbi:hypothetical protein SNEBB_008471, partial [Seison nebaliae]